MEEVQNIEIILYDKGQISAATHIEFQELYLELAPAGLALNESIRIAADGPEALEALRRALEISQQLLATTRRIRDEDARAKLVVIVVGAQAFLIVIEFVIGRENDSTNPVTRRGPTPGLYQPLPPQSVEEILAESDAQWVSMTKKAEAEIERARADLPPPG